MRIRLPVGETDATKLYSMADPEYRPDACRAVYGWLWYNEAEPDREDLLQVMSMATDYFHLTTYEAGQEHCVSQLRDIWRARRARDV